MSMKLICFRLNIDAQAVRNREFVPPLKRSKSLKEVFADDFVQPMNGKEYACCYCSEGFEPFEQPLFLQEYRVSHGSCHKAALYSQHVTIA